MDLYHQQPLSLGAIYYGDTIKQMFNRDLLSIFSFTDIKLILRVARLDRVHG